MQSCIYFREANTFEKGKEENEVYRLAHAERCMKHLRTSSYLQHNTGLFHHTKNGNYYVQKVHAIKCVCTRKPLGALSKKKNIISFIMNTHIFFIIHQMSSMRFIKIILVVIDLGSSNAENQTHSDILDPVSHSTLCNTETDELLKTT